MLERWRRSPFRNKLIRAYGLLAPCSCCQNPSFPFTGLLFASIHSLVSLDLGKMVCTDYHQIFTVFNFRFQVGVSVLPRFSIVRFPFRMGAIVLVLGGQGGISYICSVLPLTGGKPSSDQIIKNLIILLFAPYRWLCSQCNQCWLHFLVLISQIKTS